ncbi:unnamed protein product [Rotaria sp. Silwood1]|nr:unnamed protein product [Rotaria sp. Silwood1]CAF1658976.1 unnamed protein product [Rotaria sp. Silwood1]CAF3947334.1 unnamed protein product [Rotaria sp. Silwood1]
MSSTAVTPTSIVYGTVSTNRLSPNQKSKASISSSYMSDSCNGIEDDKNNDLRDENQDVSLSTKLKKHVVQIWFQNTRARKRKDNIKFDSNQLLDGSTINKKCIHCSLTFKLKSTFENHL